MNNSEDCYHLGVKALIQNDEGKVLLLKVNRKKLREEDREYWDIPGGRVQRGDTVEDTLRREVAEESGLTEIHVVRQLAMVLSNIRIPLKPLDVGLILAVYVCRIQAHRTITLSDEHLKWGWFTPGKAADLLSVKYPKAFTEQVATLGHQ